MFTLFLTCSLCGTPAPATILVPALEIRDAPAAPVDDDVGFHDVRIESSCGFDPFAEGPGMGAHALVALFAVFSSAPAQPFDPCR